MALVIMIVNEEGERESTNRFFDPRTFFLLLLNGIKMNYYNEKKIIVPIEYTVFSI